METAFDLKANFEEFVNVTKTYHERTQLNITPDEMCVQYKIRRDILNVVIDLCYCLEEGSLNILRAFKEYEENKKALGINTKDLSIFLNITNLMIKLIAENEEIRKWQGELHLKNEYLDEKNVEIMEPSDIKNMKN